MKYLVISLFLISTLSTTAQLTTDKFINFDDTATISPNASTIGKTVLNIEPLIKHSESVPFRMTVSSNRFGSWQDDNVLMFGWNLNEGGSPIFRGRPGIGYSMEQNYKPSYDASLTESHEFWIKPNGDQVRLKSYTINNNTNDVDFYHTISRMYFKSPIDNHIWGGIYLGETGDVYWGAGKFRWIFGNGAAVFESPSNLPVVMNSMAYLALPGMVALPTYTDFRVAAYFSNAGIFRSSADVAGNLTNKGYNLLSEILALKARIEQLESKIK